jgi:glycosyltransferase involved in cell wall biosynthesis
VICFFWIAGIVLALAWGSRVIDSARGARGVANLSVPQWDGQPKGELRISIIVPARNEQATIKQTLHSLLAQDYGNIEVIAVDDRSTDSTGGLMDEVAEADTSGRLKVIHVSDLPSAWMGKPHAMWLGALQATGDWLLFTDGDILFQPGCLRRALAYAQFSNADHLVLAPHVIMHGVGEKMAITFFGILFIFGHRPWKADDPKSADYVGFGAFNMIRRSTYDAIGTHQRLRFEVLDDMKLGKLVKDNGFAQRYANAGDLLSVRWVVGGIGVAHNLTKNLFALLQFKVLKSIMACIALAFLNWMPFLGVWLAPGWSRLGYAVALSSIFTIYFGVSRLVPISPLYFFLHPIGTGLFIYAVLRSMLLTLFRKGVVWRGTLYPLDELRKGLV